MKWAWLRNDPLPLVQMIYTFSNFFNAAADVCPKNERVLGFEKVPIPKAAMISPQIL